MGEDDEDGKSPPIPEVAEQENPIQEILYGPDGEELLYLLERPVMPMSWASDRDRGCRHASFD